MKRFSEQFKKKSDSIRLSARQRADLRARLESYMEYHPLPSDMKTIKKTPVRKVAQGLVSEPFKVISINMTYLRGFIGVFTVFMIVGIPIIAEYSVPGDILYPVKTNITEEVRATLTLSPYAKVQWETTRLERRVAEARLLASEGKLTPEVEASVAEAIQEHTDAAVSEIALLKKDDEDKAALAEIAFASALSVQAEVLSDSQVFSSDSDITEEGYSVTNIATMIADASQQADVIQADTDLSYETLLATVEMETTHAYELFESVQKVASPQEISDIKRRLEDVERKVEVAISQHTKMQNTEIPVASTPETVPQPEDVQTVSIDAEGSPSEISISDISTSTVFQTQASTTELFDAPAPGIPEEDIQHVLSEPLLEQEKEEESTVFLRTALSDLQKLIIFMTDIDIRQNVSIETLVPVTPTNEEQVEAVIEELDEVIKIQSDIEGRINEDSSNEKALKGQEMLSKQVERISQLLEEGNVDGAQMITDQAHALAEDVQIIIDRQPKQEVLSNPVQEELAEIQPPEVLATTSESHTQSNDQQKDVIQ